MDTPTGPSVQKQAHTEIEAWARRWSAVPGDGQPEVGHLTIGAGRVIYQDVMRISKAIETGAFARNEVLLGAIRWRRENGPRFIGVCSPTPHSLNIFALLELAAICNIALHAARRARHAAALSAQIH